MTRVDGAGTREAGRSSSETISCNLGQWYPELSSGSPYAGTDSELTKWACMPAEDENIRAHDYDCRDNGGGFDGGECGDQLGVKKGPWTTEEDEKLRKCVEELGVGNWVKIEKCSGLGRTSKSCRLRWINHLRPNLRKGCFTPEEERLLVKLHKIHGNKWSYIASKLPGRTDNEVKNFWHGRERRCHRKFLPIYPENIEEDEACRSRLDIDGKNHLHYEHHSSISMVDTERTSQHDVPFQGQPNSVDKQNLSSTFTPSETQLFSPHQRPVLSPHGQSCFTTQMPASQMSVASQNRHPSIQQFQSTEISPMSVASQNPLMSFQEYCLSPQQSSSKTVAFTSLRPPPVLSSLPGKFRGHQRMCSPLSSPRTITQFSAAEQCSSFSASGSLHTSSRMNFPPPISPTTLLLHSSKLHVSVEPPATSFEQLDTSSTLPDICCSNLDSQNYTGSIQPGSCLWKNQFAIPSLVFPEEWDYFIPEPPSIQTPTSAYRPIPEMKIDQLEPDAALLDAPTREAKGGADTLCHKSLEKQYVDGCQSLTKDPAAKMLENGTYKENVSCESTRQGGFFCENSRRSNELDQSLKLEHAARGMPNTEEVVNQRLCRKFSDNGCFGREALMGKVSRREGLLSEISKTGVLLVERGKKETILRALLDKSSTPESLTRKRSKAEEAESVPISKRGKFLGKNFKDSESEMCNGTNSVEDVLGENYSSLRNQNQEEILLDINSRRSVSLNLQRQTSDQDAFREVPCAAISRGNDMLPPRFGHGAEMAVLNSGGEKDYLKYSAPIEGFLNEICREERPDTLKAESLCHQAQTVYDISEDLLLGGFLTSQDQQKVLQETFWDLDQCTAAITNPLSWVNQEDIWNTVQPCEDDLFRADANNGSRERLLPLESSTQRTITLDELGTNQFVSSTSGAGFGQCKEEQKTNKEMEKACNTLPEDFSNLLECVPAGLPDWYDMDGETSSISDMIFGFEMSYHSESSQ